MKKGSITKLMALFALLLVPLSSTQANDTTTLSTLKASFDAQFGTKLRIPPDYAPEFKSPFEERIADLANGSRGRIGVAALDLATGQTVSILGNQPFPMASTSKVAIAATFLEQVDQGKKSLSDKYHLQIPISRGRFSGKVAPVRNGADLPASRLLELMLVYSNNYAADAMIKAVGGTKVVDAWAHRAGIKNFDLSRNINTLVRDDGKYNPATHITRRDAATPDAMVKLLAGLYQGRWLSPSSRRLLLATMEKCRTGTNRIPGDMPDDVTVAHKTGTLHNVSSDIGILTAPDGRTIALAIYVTGQGSHARRDRRIREIARAIYNGYTRPSQPRRQYADASYQTADAQ